MTFRRADVKKVSKKDLENRIYYNNMFIYSMGTLNKVFVMHSNVVFDFVCGGQVSGHYGNMCSVLLKKVCVWSSINMGSDLGAEAA